MQNEIISAFVDGEITEAEVLRLLSSEEDQVELLEHWQRYHLMRDLMRDDAGSFAGVDFASGISQALESEQPKVYNTNLHQVNTERDENRTTLNVTPLVEQPKASEYRHHTFLQKMGSWFGQFSQIAVAASVAVAVLVGVQHYSTESLNDNQEITPVLDTLPVGGVASPVSYGVPTQIDGNHIQQLQEQRRRIDAMLQDYELQRRLHDEQLQGSSVDTGQPPSPLLGSSEQPELGVRVQ